MSEEEVAKLENEIMLLKKSIEAIRSDLYFTWVLCSSGILISFLFSIVILLLSLL